MFVKRLVVICAVFAVSSVYAIFDNPNVSVPLVNVEGEPSAFVNGTVNALSGDYCESEVDLVVAGPEPLVFYRSYCSGPGMRASGDFYSGWNQNFPCKAFSEDYKDSKAMMISQPSGGVLPYCRHVKSKRGNGIIVQLDDAIIQKGLTNCGHGEIGGRTNMKNRFLKWGQKHLEYWLVDGTGGSRHYSLPKWIKNSKRDKKRFYLLDETRPNGNKLVFEYLQDNYKGKSRLVEINGCNASGAVFNELYLQREKFKRWRKDPVMTVVSGDGRKVSYSWQRFYWSDRGEEFFLRSVAGPAGAINYTYVSHPREGMQVSRVDRPGGRFLQTQYYPYNGAKKSRDKVSMQLAPTGTDATAQVVCRFFYDVKDGRTDQALARDEATDVYDAVGGRTRYYSNVDQRLSAVEHFHRVSGSYQRHSIERLSWGAVRSKDVSNLLSRSLEDGSGHTAHRRDYTYDDEGNILADTLSGNLTGTGNGSYAKRYEYSADGFNLVTREIFPEGREIGYRYYSGSDRLAAKLICVGGRVVTREFYEYDENAMLSRKVVDDGDTEDVNDLTGVTERRISTVTGRKEAPGMGLPEVITESYWDRERGERQLKKVVKGYSPEGWVVSEEVYDGDDAFCYRCEYIYDAMGNVVYEKNALGYEIRRRFDAAGNKIYEQGPRSDCYCVYAYDFSNRLIREELNGTDGIRLTTTHRYDLASRRIAMAGPLGNENCYSYNDLGQCVRTVFPALSDGTNPVETKEYDVLGKVSKVVDPMGEETVITHNARGQPLVTEYSDGTREENTYTLGGLPAKKVAVDGSSTCCTYDELGRLVKEEVYSADGVLDSGVQHVYSDFHEVEKIDGEGNVTSYQYDGAGRKIAETTGHRVTRYEYDTLGRLYRRVEGDGEEATVHVSEFDLMDRVVEKRVEDGAGAVQEIVQYVYDEVGNCIVKMEYTSEGVATTLTEYTVDNKVSRMIDPCGDTTVIEYDRSRVNDLGQRILRTMTTDALGRQSISVTDALGNVVVEERRDPYGSTLAKSEIRYDLGGHRVAVEHTVIALDRDERTTVTKWEYGLRGKVEAIIEGVGTEEQKTTRYTYNDKGQKESVVKPDGVAIEHRYDGVGRLLEYVATDFSFGYRYSYDGNGNVVEVENLVTGKRNRREYDACQRVSREVLGSEVALGREYDTQGRCRTLTLPDGSSVEHLFEGKQMVEVRRLDGDGREQYCHHYREYDLSGRLMTSEAIGAVGVIDYSHDLKGRLAQIDHSHYSATVPDGGYDAVGNLSYIDVKDPVGETNGAFDYDDLNQLTAEEGVAEHQYAHDSLGNRVEKNGEEYSVDAVNRLNRAGHLEFGYDPNGNMVKRVDGSAATEYRYDALDRLVEVVCSDGMVVSYTYDSFNRRLSKRVLEGVSGDSQGEEVSYLRFIFDDQNEIGAVDGEGAVVELRVLGAGGYGAEIGAAVAIEVQGRVYCPVHDIRGNVAVMVDASDGRAVEVYRYSAFGEEQVYTRGWAWGWKKSSAEPISPWRYSSKRVDVETGFVFFGRRCYAPDIGRWVSPDPMGLEAGPNLYTYLSNNPLTHWDLYGLFVVDFLRSFSDKMSATARWAGQGVSRAISDGAKVTTGTASNFWGEATRERSLFFNNPRNGSLGRPEVGDNVRVTCVNGILNGIKDALASAMAISRSHGGVNVHSTWDPTICLEVDILKTKVPWSALRKQTVDKLVLNWKDRIFEMGGVDGGGKIIHYAHSAGVTMTAEALLRLSSAERNMIDVRTFGGSEWLPDGAAKKVTNYVSTRDDISRLAAKPSGSGAHVDWLPAQGRHLLPDHSFLNNTYQTRLRKLGSEFVKDYGVARW